MFACWCVGLSWDFNLLLYVGCLLGGVLCLLLLLCCYFMVVCVLLLVYVLVLWFSMLMMDVLWFRLWVLRFCVGFIEWLFGLLCFLLVWLRCCLAGCLFS